MLTHEIMRKNNGVMCLVLSGAEVEDVCSKCGGPESTHGKITDRSTMFPREFVCNACIVTARNEREKAWQEKFRNKASSLPGRNDPCHCGSKKKYKKCCGNAA